jgi:hypothetical protein
LYMTRFTVFSFSISLSAPPKLKFKNDQKTQIWCFFPADRLYSYLVQSIKHIGMAVSKKLHMGKNTHLILDVCAQLRHDRAERPHFHPHIWRHKSSALLNLKKDIFYL